MRDKRRDKLIALNMFFIASIISANVMATKLFSLFGTAMPAGVIAFPISFLVTDVINEVWGKEEASLTVKLGFLANIISMILISISIKLPPFEFWEMQEAYSGLLGSMPRITLAGFVAYIFSNAIDVNIFDALKKKHNGEKLWIRNNVSTIIAQVADSFIFIFVAFYGVMPVKELVVTALLQLAVKSVLALLDTPFCYLGVRWVRK